MPSSRSFITQYLTRANATSLGDNHQQQQQQQSSGSKQEGGGLKFSLGSGVASSGPTTPHGRRTPGTNASGNNNSMSSMGSGKLHRKGSVGAGSGTGSGSGGGIATAGGGRRKAVAPG
jgi:hypothetical protein